MKRKPHTPEEKARTVIEVLRGERTLNEIASEHEIHPNMLTRWKKEALEGLVSVFENDNSTLQRRELVDFMGKSLSVSQQEALLEINRSSLYYKPVATDSDDLLIKMHDDEPY